MSRRKSATSAKHKKLRKGDKRTLGMLGIAALFIIALFVGLNQLS